MFATPNALRTLLAAGLLSVATFGPALAADDELTMFKDPNCGCCGKWAEHMRANGFSVKEVATHEMDAVKRKAGVPPALASCHTAKIGGYIIEGHVPAAQVIELTRRNDLAGVAVPGMPKGSPGMEAGGVVQPYEVIGLTASGTEQVIAEYPGN